MKKLCVFLSMLCLLAGSFSLKTAINEKTIFTAFAQMAESENGRVVIQRAAGRVFSADSRDKVVLSGKVFEDGLYRTDIAVTIKGKGGELTIVPEENGGYNPHVEVVSFDGVKDQIFYGADSGGSGGFGYYYVFDVQKGKAVTLFDAEKYPVPYTARYVDCFKVEVKNTDTGEIVYIYLSGRDEEYLSALYYKDGRLKSPVEAMVSAVNAASPFYLNGESRYGLELFYRITGLYNADGLGNIVVRTSLIDGKFLPFYEIVGSFKEN